MRSGHPNRKDHRKPYRKSKRFDRSYRNHGSCNWCEENRMHNTIKRQMAAAEDDYENYEEIDADEMYERDNYDNNYDY